MTSALIGISADNGKQWHFVDGSSKGDLASILPDVKQLNVPQATQPVKWPTEFNSPYISLFEVSPLHNVFAILLI
jgi:hypothetical protein